MTKLPRFLAIAAFAVAASSPVLAQQNDAITIYDQPQQQDGFFQAQRGVFVPDVTATGSIGGVSAPAPFYSAHEYSRKRAEDNN